MVMAVSCGCMTRFQHVCNTRTRLHAQLEVGDAACCTILPLHYYKFQAPNKTHPIKSGDRLISRAGAGAGAGAGGGAGAAWALALALHAQGGGASGGGGVGMALRLRCGFLGKVWRALALALALG